MSPKSSRMVRSLARFPVVIRAKVVLSSAMDSFLQVSRFDSHAKKEVSLMLTSWGI